MNKEIKNLFLMCAICSGIVGCSNVPTSSGTSTSENVTNLSTSSISSSSNGSSTYFEPNLESTMIEGLDYVDYNKIDVTKTGKDKEYDDSKWYINSLSDLPLPDPHVYYENGTYYITGSSDRTGSAVIDIYYTTDFVKYTMVTVYDPSTISSWENSTTPQIFAPEIYCFDGTYYIYYNALSSNGVRYMNVISSKSILGTYKYINGSTTPVFNTKTNCLDETVFVDDDKQMYMYYTLSSDGEESIWGVKLKSPYQADWSTAKQLARPGYLDSTFTGSKVLSWECYNTSYNILEGPYMLKSNGKYYLTYSANDWKNKYYCVCYAVGTSPLGNFTKPYESGKDYSNLLLGYAGGTSANNTIYKQWTGFASGIGHHCFFKIGDQLMVGYHAHQNRNYNDTNGWTPRYFAMDYVFFEDNGTPFCNGPTYSLQHLPEALSGYKNIAPEATLKTENVTNSSAINDNYCVSNYNLKGEDTKEVTLLYDEDTECAFIEFQFDDFYNIGGIQICNSSFYDKYVEEIRYIDFGYDMVLEYANINYSHINDNTEFIIPHSGFVFDLPCDIETDKITICFELYDDSCINEVRIFAR